MKDRILAPLLKYRFAILTAALGLLLLLLPQRQTDAAPAGESTPDTFDRLLLQQEMEQILSAVDGAGRLSLMLTVASGAELELAQDATARKTAAEQYERSSETLTLAKGSGVQDVVVTRSVYPAWVGALVVCEGGDRASVRLALTQALSTLTGLPSDCITVIKGQP